MSQFSIFSCTELLQNEETEEDPPSHLTATVLTAHIVRISSPKSLSEQNNSKIR